MAKKTTKKTAPKPKSDPKPIVEKEPTPEIWICKVDWVEYKRLRYVKGQELLIMPGVLTAEDEKILSRNFSKAVTKTATIISEPVELVEGD